MCLGSFLGDARLPLRCTLRSDCRPTDGEVPRDVRAARGAPSRAQSVLRRGGPYLGGSGSHRGRGRACEDASTGLCRAARSEVRSDHEDPFAPYGWFQELYLACRRWTIAVVQHITEEDFAIQLLDGNMFTLGKAQIDSWSKDDDVDSSKSGDADILDGVGCLQCIPAHRSGRDPERKVCDGAERDRSWDRDQVEGSRGARRGNEVFLLFGSPLRALTSRVGVLVGGSGR